MANDRMVPHLQNEYLQKLLGGMSENARDATLKMLIAAGIASEILDSATGKIFLEALVARHAKLISDVIEEAWSVLPDPATSVEKIRIAAMELKAIKTFCLHIGTLLAKGDQYAPPK